MDDDKKENCSGGKTTYEHKGEEDNDEYESYRQKHLQSLTIHGLSRIFSSSNRTEKYFWTSLFIVALFVVIAMISVSITKLTANKIYIGVHKKARNAVAFPAITFCSSTSTVDDLIDSNNMLVEPGRDLLLPMLKGSCLYSSYNSCNYTNDFSFLPGGKSCISFNLKQTYKQLVMGKDFGLKLILFTRPKKTKCIYNGEGVHIMIHKPNIVPVAVGEGISVAPGMETMISIRETHYRRLPSPFASNCALENTTNHNLFPGDYSSIGCYTSCFYKHFYEYCGFVPYVFKSVVPIGIFEEKEPLSYSRKAECGRQFHSMLLEQGKLDCNCPVPCKEVKYEITTSMLSWKPLSDNIKSALAMKLQVPVVNITEQIASQTLARVRLYFGSLDLEVHTENQVYDVGDLLSDFGGQMGLMLGASIISIVELLVPLLLTLCSRFASWSKWKRRDLRRRSNPNKKDSVSVIKKFTIQADTWKGFCKQ